MSLEEQISLEQFELAVFTGDVSKAEVILVALLIYASKNEGFYGKGDLVDGIPVYSAKPIAPFSKKLAFEENLQYYNRLASCITALMVNPTYVISPKCMEVFLFNKFILVDIFCTSSFRNMDHILHYRAIMDKQGQISLKSENDLNLLLFCYSIFSEANLDFSVLFADFPRHGLLTYVSALACLRTTFDAKLAKKRDDLLAQCQLLEGVKLEHHPLEYYSSTWMLCSYSAVEWKHGIKQSMNTLYAQYAQQNIAAKTQKSIQKYLKNPPSRTKQRVLVVNEHFRKEHAMFRCFSRLIEALRADFELILLSPAKEYDEASIPLFDQIIEINNDIKQVGKAAEAIANLQPDILYYPSVGMGRLTITLANYRFAKIQIMGAGHPASSYSKAMDYLILFGGGSFGEEGLQRHCSEKLVVIPDLKGSFSPRSWREYLTPQIAQKPAVVNIAINSASFKISHELIDICAALNKLSERPLYFHFFPNLRGMALDAYAVEIKRKLDNAAVYQSMGYEKMMQHLNQCDLGLGTFPFGNTNSNVDTFMLGIPKIVMTSTEEIACVADEDVFNLVNLPNWLRAENSAKFIAAALFLIHNDQERIRLSQHLLSLDYDELFFNPSSSSSALFLTKFKQIAAGEI